MPTCSLVWTESEQVFCDCFGMFLETSSVWWTCMDMSWHFGIGGSAIDMFNSINKSKTIQFPQLAYLLCFLIVSPAAMKWVGAATTRHIFAGGGRDSGGSGSGRERSGRSGCSTWTHPCPRSRKRSPGAWICEIDNRYSDPGHVEECNNPAPFDLYERCPKSLRWAVVWKNDKRKKTITILSKTDFSFPS